LGASGCFRSLFFFETSLIDSLPPFEENFSMTAGAKVKISVTDKTSQELQGEKIIIISAVL
jgi:hypothetical protein